MRFIMGMSSGYFVIKAKAALALVGSIGVLEIRRPLSDVEAATVVKEIRVRASSLRLCL